MPNSRKRLAGVFSPPTAPREVREASEEDAPGIAAVHVRSWQVAYRGLVPDAVLAGLSVDGSERSWRRLVHERGSTTLVAVGQRGIAGFCAISTPSRDAGAAERTAEIAAIYVDPDHWRRGVGTALLVEALERLRRDGWEEVTLWTFAANDAARAFYAAHGFEPGGTERKNETTGEPEVRLRRALRPRP